MKVANVEGTFDYQNEDGFYSGKFAITENGGVRLYGVTFLHDHERIITMLLILMKS